MILEADKVLRLYFSPDNRVKISPSAFTVLLAIAFEAGGDLNMPQVSCGRIQELTGINSRTTVTRAIKELEEKGFISALYSRAGQYKPQVYLLLPKK